jgi:hypothetical protein
LYLACVIVTRRDPLRSAASLPKPKRVKVGAEACGYLLLGQWPCLLPKQHEPPHRARTVSGTKLEEYTREDFYR